MFAPGLGRYHCLRAAICQGNLENVALQFSTVPGFQVNDRCTLGFQGETLLHVASRYGHLDVVQYMVEQKGALVHILDDFGCTPLHCAAKGGSWPVFEYLLLTWRVSLEKNNASERCWDNPDHQGRTPLLWACHFGHLHLVKHLIQQLGAKVNHTDVQRCTPFFLAADAGHVDIVEYLFKSEPLQMNCTNHVGCSPLLAAVRHNRHKVAKLLLECGAKIHQADQYGVTPFSFACDFKKPNAMYWMLRLRPELWSYVTTSENR